MHVHILGICGTFMGSLAVLAKQLGHRVSGSDVNVYPPMSTQLQQLGIDLNEGYRPEHMQPPPDLVIIGNALSRGNPAVEYVLNEGLSYMSGPQWLAQFVLHDKWVLGVAGTHGKTTTSAMLTWILEYARMKPGYLIGGVANNFPQSASIGDSAIFVVEADEYDSAFFDKRSKFVHYAPRTVILNNLEYDHSDIFENLEVIEKQFHHLVRTVPGNGLIIYPHGDFVQPNLPPPDFDKEILFETLNSLEKLEINQLAIAHFGIHKNPYELITSAKESIEDWISFISKVKKFQ